jgi:hypothetical protein
MFRRSLIALFALLLAVPVLTAAAPSPRSFSLPDQASEVAPGVFFLGHAVEDGVDLVGYAYARYATADERGNRANAKPDNPGGGGGKPGGGGGGNETVSSCYSYIAKGAHWISPESYLFEPTGGTLSSVDSKDTDAAFKTWESAVSVDTTMVKSGTSVPLDSGLAADTSTPDERNEIYFASISDTGVLGYTIVWFTRSRGRFVGQIVEADMVIDNDSEWNWYTVTSTGTSTGMGNDEIDFWSVFTHEAGHWVGMGHTDTTDLCKDQTMYPFISSDDSTNKRMLGEGDTTGIAALYG